MNLNRSSLVVAACAALLSVGAVAMALNQDGAPPMPEPAPEHKILMERLGTWDCEMQMWMGPGEPQKTTGVETNRAIGGFHVASEFTSDMLGMDFHGIGISSWDPAKKKFISLWADSLEAAPALMEGTYDAKSRTITFVGENMMMGERTKMRQTVVLKDADHAAFEMFITGADGKEMKTLHFDYTRRK
ncbi:MAG: DUF1579 domain-containing protein [Planctomycetes bacterium]|nr:DUF1579 domain-containing protein [Planctomycetota bacterium]